MINYNKTDRLGIVTLNKPPANSYDIEFFMEFEKILNAIEADKEIAVVLLKSAITKFFSAGADIKVFGNNTIEENKEMVVMARKVAAKISHSGKVFIAFLNGHTLGGGLELAMACDIRLATDKNILLGLPEVSLGLMPGNGGIPRLINLIGVARAFELIVSGRTISPQEAFNFGLINKLYNEAQAEELAFEYATKLSKGPKLAMTAIKQTFIEGIGKNLEEFLQLEKDKVNNLYETFDAREGFQAFLEKRAPKFL
ncbi:MAG: enoyl-CoA hydratase-related protein [Maribacter sp.]